MLHDWREPDHMLEDWPIGYRSPPILEAVEDPSSPFAKSPFARCLGIRIGEDGALIMPFSPKIVGNPILPAIHGGIIGALLETTAIAGVTRDLGVSALPKPIGLTINYLRSGRALDSYANVSIVKQGRRVVALKPKLGRTTPPSPSPQHSVISCCGRSRA